VTFNNGTTNITENNVLYSFANFSSSTPALVVSSSLASAWSSIILPDINTYWNQPWADQRTSSVFGVFPGNAQYQAISRNLVNDWGSVFAPFVCSSLFCNNKGYCSIGPVNAAANNSTNVSRTTPICTCIGGWRGKRCVFPSEDYQYGLDWTIGSNLWLNGSVQNNTLNMNDTATFSALANIAGLIPQFTSQVESSDVAVATALEQQLITVLSNMTVNYSDPNITTSIVNLVNSLMAVNDTLLGANPVDVLNKFGTANGTNTTNFIYYAIAANTTGNTLLSLPPGSVSRRGLFRFLQANLNIFNLNTASPTVTIPLSISQSINNGSNLTYSLAAIRNPKPLMNSADNYIHSQIIGESVFMQGNPKKFFNFTNNATNLTTGNATNSSSFLTVTLPWAYIPFNLKNNASYLNNCKIYRYNGNSFVPTNTCVLLNTTNQNNAMLNCLNLDIIGVGCGGNNSNVVLTTTGGNGIGPGVNGTGSSSGRITFVSSILAVLLLFVL